MKILRSKYQENISKVFAERSFYGAINFLEILQWHFPLTTVIYKNSSITIPLTNHLFFQKEIYKNIYD